MQTESKRAIVRRRQRDSVRVCTRFGVFTVLVFAGLYAAQPVLVAPLNRHCAWITAQVLQLVGGHVVLSGPVVGLSHFAIEIKNNCNALFEVGLYAAAVWAYPAPWRARLWGTLMGASVLYGVNVLRLLTLLTVGLLQPAWFEVTHLYVWQIVFVLLVATCWLAWVHRVRPGA